MRIISGSLKGRIISAPAHFKIRPTTDLAKESLFNILANSFDFDEIRVLDLFAGIGSISFECASRGCEHIISVEKNFTHASFIKQQAEKLELSQIQVKTFDIRDYLKTTRETFDIVFADPPYDLQWLQNIPDLIYASSCLHKESTVIIEHPGSVNFSEHPHFSHIRKYGKVHFSWFS